VNLAGRKAAILLTEDGKQVVHLAGINLPETSLILVVIHETEGIGIWFRIERGNEEHWFLLRWEYILGIDVSNETPGNLKGFKR
jgi:hypothetical protein